MANLDDYVATMSACEDHEPPFSISHVFQAPRVKVWQAGTERDHLIKGFGPKGLQMLQATLDLSVGGMFHYCMSQPNGMEMWGSWVFRTISRPDRLEFVNSFSNFSGELMPAPFQGLDDFPPEVLTSVTLVDHAGIGNGTLVTVEALPLHGTKAQRDF